MAKDSFTFRRFTVRQDRCAMKVGTDGTLLGAWASVPDGACRMLDIGCGTGLIALMLAQRCEQGRVVALDIDPEAVSQAHENVSASPFADRIEVVEADAADYQGDGCYCDNNQRQDCEASANRDARFDAIVSNPPYFVSSLACPDDQRTLARHACSLSYRTLCLTAFRLLADDGTFAVVIPTDCRSSLEAEARLCGFSPVRICAVRTTPRKQPKRYLIEFRKHAVSEIDISEEVLETEPGHRSRWYQQLTQDFYL